MQRSLSRAFTLAGLALSTACGEVPPCPATPAPSPPSANATKASPVTAREQREGFDVGSEADAAAGLDLSMLAKIRERSARERSAALIVVRDGQLVVEDYFGGSADRTRMAMSVTKSVVALGLGALVEDGLLELDAPLSAKLFPELAKTDKAGITLRHLMSHTSGLPTKRAGTDPSSWAKASIERHVLDHPLETPIGERFAYNNSAVDFLSAVVRRASPETPFLDDVLHFGLFEKLGVHSVSWMRDGRGDPRAAGELMIRPIDLAKIGQVVLEGGTFRGKRIVRAEWVETLLAPGQSITDECGLLWWRDGNPATYALSERRLSLWKKSGVDDETVSAARPLLGKRFTTSAAAADALSAALGADRFAALRSSSAKKLKMFDTTTDVKAYRADGYLGQYIVVVPSARLVAVRMRDGRETSWNPEELSYEEFPSDVMKLARVRPASP